MPWMIHLFKVIQSPTPSPSPGDTTTQKRTSQTKSPFQKTTNHSDSAGFAETKRRIRCHWHSSIHKSASPARLPTRPLSSDTTPRYKSAFSLALSSSSSQSNEPSSTGVGVVVQCLNAPPLGEMRTCQTTDGGSDKATPEAQKKTLVITSYCPAPCVFQRLVAGLAVALDFLQVLWHWNGFFFPEEVWHRAVLLRNALLWYDLHLVLEFIEAFLENESLRHLTTISSSACGVLVSNSMKRSGPTRRFLPWPGMGLGLG